MKSIVLASMSSSRYQLLQKLGLPFTADAPNIDETPLTNESATFLVTRLATEKAKALAIKYPTHLIIGADQVGILANQIIGKPLTHTATSKQLKQASGKKNHLLYRTLLISIVKLENIILNVNFSPFIFALCITAKLKITC